MVTPTNKRPLAAIKRPPRIPKNLRYVPWIAIPVVILQLIVIMKPPKLMPVHTPKEPTITISPVVQARLLVFQNGSKLNSGSVVQPGTELEFRLISTNTNRIAFPTSVSLPVDDILQYANITDLKGATIRRGRADWPTELVPAGHTSTHQLFVQVHNVPSARATSGQNYDYHLTTRYGNIVDIALQPSLAKQIEQYVRRLPKLPAYIGLVSLLAVLAIWAILYHQATKGKRISHATGTVLIGWFAGAATLLIVVSASAYHSGFALSGSEALIGGCLGVLCSAPIVLLKHVNSPV